MPKIPRLTSKKLLKILYQEGFVIDRQTGSHLILYHPNSKRRAVVPRHNRDLPIGTLRSILLSAGINPREIK
ncbi:MAG TPA: type II toxin-antitoxin system HicA family toxin [Candidatus Andersenbacteria bacterium]|nr:type II toxin-antitoxin system HicA family toxin [Candidatus Andersenbacteria bacterium]